jgi:hypothetical protein
MTEWKNQDVVSRFAEEEEEEEEVPHQLRPLEK